MTISNELTQPIILTQHYISTYNYHHFIAPIQMEITPRSNPIDLTINKHTAPTPMEIDPPIVPKKSLS